MAESLSISHSYDQKQATTVERRGGYTSVRASFEAIKKGVKFELFDEENQRPSSLPRPPKTANTPFYNKLHTLTERIHQYKSLFG